MIPIELKSERYSIRPYHKRDENSYLEMVLDSVSIEFMGGGTGIESEEREVFKKIFEIYKDNNQRIFWIWGIYEKSTLIGHLELKETAYTSADELEIVYIIHPNFRNNGVMTEILSLVRANREIWKRKIVATVNHKNSTSIKTLRKWGIAKKEVLVGEEILKLTLLK